MKTFKHALSLALAAGLLSACGGGGGSNSPDRPGLELNPNTLRIAFVDNNNVLAATGNGKISARLLGKQSDGVDTEQTPERNVTKSDNTTWSIVEPNDVAELGDIRDAGGTLGDVQDILSSISLDSDDTPVSLTLKAVHSFKGTDYSVSSPFTVQPPIPDGTPYLEGPTEILFDPLTPETRAVEYQLLQALKQLPTPENKTRDAVFCSSDTAILAFGEPQPPTSDTAEATVTNPFPDTDGTQTVNLEVYAMAKGFACSQRGEEDPNNEDAIIQAIDVITVTLVPGTVADGDIAVCAIINPASDACGDNGRFNEAHLADCRGLDTDNSSSINVPAGELLQLVAQLKYTNPSNPNQTPITRYSCSAPERLVWSADSSTIFTNGPDAADGSAALLSRSEYQAIKDSNPGSTVKGTFDNTPGTNGGDISDTLQLKLVDSQVTAISIVPVPADRDPADSLPLNILKAKLEYRAECTFGENDAVVASCGNSCVGWSVGDPDVIQVDPTVGSNTFVSSPDYTTEGQSQLTATFSCSNFGGDQTPSDSRTITATVDPVVELHLLQVSNANEPDVRNVDTFSCVGRTDLIGTLGEGDTYIQGKQQFYAHALFESDSQDLAPADMADVTQADAVIFSALPGYANNDGTCTTGLPLNIPVNIGDEEESGGPLSMIPILGDLLDFYLSPIIDVLTLPLDQLPGVPGNSGLPGLSSGPAASFSTANKGQLDSKGLLRLSTVCVQAFIDENGDGELSENEQLALESSTVFAMPAADDALLNYSNEVCEILEPVLTLGSGLPVVGDVLPAGILMPLVYGVSLITDPVLSAVATNDDGGVLPVEEILDALITGNFSELSIPGQPEFSDAPFGLGSLTGVLLEGMDDIPGLGALVDGLDACLVDPLTATVNGLLSTLLTLDPSSFGDLTGIGFNNDCETVFSGLPIPAP